MEQVTFCEKVKYGRRCFYPTNEPAHLFCELILRSGTGRDIAKSLSERQIEIIKRLGFDLKIEQEVIRRRGRIDPAFRAEIAASGMSEEELAKRFDVSVYTVRQIRKGRHPYGPKA